jgi:nucleotide-binding universal stress UspA family protein
LLVLDEERSMSTNENPPRHGVVVGIDGSEASREALEWAAREAVLRELPLEAVTTWEYPIAYGQYPAWPGDFDFSVSARTKLEETIDTVLGERSDLALSTFVVEGHPALVLQDLSKSAALIVVGSRGHGGFAGLLLGSVSEHLAAHAHCPVLIVHGSRDTSTAMQ